MTSRRREMFVSTGHETGLGTSLFRQLRQGALVRRAPVSGRLGVGRGHNGCGLRPLPAPGSRPPTLRIPASGLRRPVERPFGDEDRKERARKAMDAKSKERGRDYLAADIFLTAARLGGDAAINRLPKETLPRARRFLARVMAHQLAKRAGSRQPT